MMPTKSQVRKLFPDWKVKFTEKTIRVLVAPLQWVEVDALMIVEEPTHRTEFERTRRNGEGWMRHTIMDQEVMISTLKGAGLNISRRTDGVAILPSDIVPYRLGVL